MFLKKNNVKLTPLAFCSLPLASITCRGGWGQQLGHVPTLCHCKGWCWAQGEGQGGEEVVQISSALGTCWGQRGLIRRVWSIAVRDS